MSAASTERTEAWMPASRKVPEGRYMAFFKKTSMHRKVCDRYGIIQWPGVWMNKKHYPKGCIVTHLRKLPKAPK